MLSSVFEKVIMRRIIKLPCIVPHSFLLIFCSGCTFACEINTVDELVVVELIIEVPRLSRPTRRPLSVMTSTSGLGDDRSYKRFEEFPLTLSWLSNCKEVART
jgi:hypothetical protein